MASRPRVFTRTPDAVGYDQHVEDSLLDAAGWEGDGYELFSIATPAASSRRGLFGPMGESSSLFMPRALWNELGGLDERFALPGGGLVNHDLYRRACLLDDVQLVVVLGEGTFHQIHGGAATSSRVTTEQMRAEYETIRGEPHRPPPNEPLFVGGVPGQYGSYLARSVELADARRRRRRTFDGSLGRSRHVNPGRNTSSHRVGWYVGDDDGVGADSSAVADSNGADDLLAVGADGDTRSDRWPIELPLAESDRHERCDACTRSDLGKSVDHDLSVEQVQARRDDDGVTDGDLREHHRRSVREAWREGHAAAWSRALTR